MRATASGGRPRPLLGRPMLLLLLVIAAASCCCVGRAFVMPVMPGAARPATAAAASSKLVGSSLSTGRRLLTPLPSAQRRGAPLWVQQGQPFEDETETPAEMVRSFAAERGVDARQLNFLLNVAFLTLVSATVLAKVATVDLEFWRGWTPMEIFFRIPLDNWDGYMNVLTSHPIIVKGITSSSVYTLGDWVAQMYEGKGLGEIDRMRVARSAAAGLIGHGPLSHFWYGVSEGFFDFLGWEGWWTTFPKIAVDQLVWSPIWNGCYIALLGIMKRESIPEIWNSIRSTAFSLITSGLKLWPLAHVVTYGLIPVENRLLWVDLVEILWVTVLSSEAAGADAAKEEAAAAADGVLAAAPSTSSQSSGSSKDAAAVTTFAATELAAPASMKKQQQQLTPVPVPVASEQQEGPLLP